VDILRSLQREMGPYTRRDQPPSRIPRQILREFSFRFASGKSLHLEDLDVENDPRWARRGEEERAILAPWPLGARTPRTPVCVHGAASCGWCDRIAVRNSIFASGPPRTQPFPSIRDFRCCSVRGMSTRKEASGVRSLED